MPIYEYYCPDNHTIYQFFAKTLAHGQVIPPCPDNPAFRMQKTVSSFAISRGLNAPSESTGAFAEGSEGTAADDARMQAAMSAMEGEFAQVDENDPRAMARMMRRMAELTGEKIDGEMEEVVRKLEEGADPDSLEGQMGDSGSDEDPLAASSSEAGNRPETKEKKHRFRVHRAQPRRDPALYDYP